MTDNRLLRVNRLVDRHSRYHEYFRRQMNKAYDWGTFVTVRTQVQSADTSSVPCPVCFDEVRQEARDPKCPQCNGNGWVKAGEPGYAPLIMCRAHIGTEPDEMRRTQHGFVYANRTLIWLAYTGVRLRDGDLVAEVLPDNVENPTLVREVLRKYEVISNETPDFTPGQPVDANYAAQHVSVANIDRGDKDFNVDMGEAQRGEPVGYWGQR